MMIEAKINFRKKLRKQGQIDLGDVETSSEKIGDEHVTAWVRFPQGKYVAGLTETHKLGIYPHEKRISLSHIQAVIRVSHDGMEVHNFGGTFLNERGMDPGEKATLGARDTVRLMHGKGEAMSIRLSAGKSDN